MPTRWPVRFAALTLAAALAGGLAGAPGPAVAQTTPAPNAVPPEQERSPIPPPPAAGGPTGPGQQAPGSTAGAEPKTPSDPVSRVQAGQVPTGPTARLALLNDLYALLATAEDEEAAKKIGGAIERVWSYSGSDTVSVLMGRAIKAVGQKNEALAEKMFDAVVEMAPDYAEGWNRRAFFHYKRNDLSRAAGDLRRALALDPNHYRALEGLASIMRDTGDDKRAFQAFERLIEINPLGEGVQKAYDDLKVKVQGRGL